MKAVKQRPKSSTGNLSLILKRIFFKHNSSGGRSRSIRREPPTMGGLATGKLYHLRLQIECTFFGNLQSWARTNAILVIIGLYELLGNPTT
jgi:hypothetical protein